MLKRLPKEKKMNQALDIVKSYHKAFENKNWEKARSLLHDSFTFDGPMMQIGNADEFMSKMTECEFTAKHKEITSVTNGDQIVMIFDWIVEKPFQDTIRMCEHFKIQDGKILASNLFFDTAKFPDLEQDAA